MPDPSPSRRKRADRRRARAAIPPAPEALEARRLLDAAGVIGNASTATPLALGVTAAAVPNRPATIGAPGTPVYTTYFGLSTLPDAVSTPAHPAYPWLASFDQTTQTLWMDLRGPAGDSSQPIGGGDSVIQIDPATATAKTFDLRRFEPNPSTSNGEPHGISFDFESRLEPRIWFTQRQSSLLNFIDPSDPAHNKLVSYEFGTLLRSIGLNEANGHAVTVSRSGNVWVGDVTDKVLLEFDFHHLPDGRPTASLDSLVGTMTVHPFPQAIQSQSGLTTEFVGPHGIEIITDEQTGQDHVWFTNFGNGRISLLLPGGGAGGQDLWLSYDVSRALGTNPRGNLPLFPFIDTNETPGYPQDDTIYFADAGSEGANANNLIRQLVPGPISSTGAAGPAVLKTFRIPTADPAKSPIAGPQQVFVNREGQVTFTDRRTGFGRLDPAAFPQDPSPGATIQEVPDVFLQPPGPSFLVQPSRQFDFGAVPSVPLTTSIVPNQDVSTTPGLDQYLLRDVASGSNRVIGPPRATTDGESVLFSSLTDNELVASSIFAETARRPLTVTTGPGTGRQVFQVLRSGQLVLTYREDGEIIDHQVNLTRQVAGPAIVGDPSAVTDGGGVVHVFGRDAGGGLLQYRFDPRSGATVAGPLAPTPPGAGILAANPTAFTFGGPVPGAAALVTTSQGHLILFADGAASAVNLTAAVGGGASALVYSTVGVAQANGAVYAYGTNQLGGLVEYQFPASGGPVASRLVKLPGGRDTEVFQDVTAVSIGGVRHVFAVDGTGRLVHITAGGPGGDTAENVTELTQATATGYGAYQQPYAGRVYTGLGAAVNPTTGDLYVYGNNGRDLVEFRQHFGTWQVNDLTNNLAAGQPANRVSGAPAAYITPDGGRHILLISLDAEVVEYDKLAGSQFSTANLTLALGNGGSPPAFTNPPPAAPPAIPVGPTTLAPDAANRDATAAGFLQAPGSDQAFRFKAGFTGRVAFTVTAPSPGLGPVLALGRSTLRARAVRRGGPALVATLTTDVVAGGTYSLIVSGAGKTTGGFSIAAHYLSVSHPRRPPSTAPRGRAKPSPRR